MNKGRSRFAPTVCTVLENLESRVALSGIGSGALPRAAEVTAQAVRAGTTSTTLSVSAGTLGQPVTFTVTVRARAAAGAPQGTVNIMEHGALIETLTLAPTTSSNPGFAYSQATYTLTPQPGGGAPFFGRYAFTAEFVPSGPFSRSSAHQVASVTEPTFTTLADGVQIANITQGSGPAIESGQTAGVLYTGYIARTGKIFDDSSSHGGTPFSFTLGSGQVIPGFDEGTTGMQVGETRIVVIPPSEGYGDVANGPIPRNSTLVFLLTLESIS